MRTACKRGDPFSKETLTLYFVTMDQMRGKRYVLSVIEAGLRWKVARQGSATKPYVVLKYFLANRLGAGARLVQ